MAKPQLILIGGINGAGKTTLYYNQIKPYLESKGQDVPFVNADEMEKIYNYPDSYVAAQKAAELREQLLESKQSFVTETVFSHSSKNELIDKAKESGFNVVLNHVHVDNPSKAFDRVKTRVHQGGHDVPEDKVHSRFPRTIQNIKKAVDQADYTYVWDNNRTLSAENLDKVSHRFVMVLKDGGITKLATNIPNWANDMYSEKIEEFEKK